MEQQSHTDTDSSFIHVLKSIHLLVFFLCQSTQHLYISPKNRLKERCPKECVYKLPINTQTPALMHAHTRTHTNSVHPLVSSLQAILSVSVGHAPSSQPRRGTFGSSFSGKNRQNKNKNVGCYLLSSFVFLCILKSKHIEFNLEFRLGLKRHSK